MAQKEKAKTETPSRSAHSSNARAHTHSTRKGWPVRVDAWSSTVGFAFRFGAQLHHVAFVLLTQQTSNGSSSGTNNNHDNNQEGRGGVVVTMRLRRRSSLKAAPSPITHIFTIAIFAPTLHPCWLLLCIHSKLPRPLAPVRRSTGFPWPLPCP